MKLLLLTLSLVAFYSSASASKFDCKYLDYNLVLESKGFDHIIHKLSINGKTPVTEIVDGNWFIEEVNCKKTGYEIIASHAQYNDTTQQVFMLTYSDKLGYKVIKGI